MGRNWTWINLVAACIAAVCLSCGRNGSNELVPAQSNKQIAPVISRGEHQSSAVFTISGRTRTGGGGGIPGVLLTFSGDAGTSTSDSNGNYVKSGLVNGTYTITPSKTGWVFSPTSKTVMIQDANQIGINFVGSSTYTISGYVRKSDYSGINGVTVTFKQGSETLGTTTTNASGWFQRSGFSNGTYTLSVGLDGWWFNPTSKNATVNGGNLYYVNFYGSDLFTVAGRVRTTGYSGISGVTINISNGGGSVSTNATGNYTKTGLPAGTYTITPNKPGFTFSPTSKTITFNNSNHSGINFIANARGDWWMFGRDLLHTRRSSIEGPQAAELEWSYLTNPTSLGVLSSASLNATGGIYFGSSDGYLYSLDSDGNLLWSFSAGSAIRSTPAIGEDGTIYFGSMNASFYALNPDGTQKWKYDTGSSSYGIISSPCIGTDASVYFASNDSYVYALTQAGSLKWRFQAGAGFWYSSPAISPNGTLYVGGMDDQLYALNIDGADADRLVWACSLPELMPGSPAVAADGTIYIGCGDDKLYAINPDGSTKWSLPIEGRAYGCPAINADGTVFVGSVDNRLYAVNPNGTLAWGYMTGGDIFGSPAIGGDGSIYFGSYDGNIYALEPDGSLKWSYPTGGAIYSSPSISTSGALYIGSSDDYLYALKDD